MAQSWSGIRRRLENDLLAPSLKGRVKYFITKYRKTNDDEARLAIIVDGKEILKENLFDFYKEYFPLCDKLREDLDVPRRDCNDEEILYEKENKDLEEMCQEFLVEEGIFRVWRFTESLETYFNQSIQESIYSDDLIVRMFAILDRRVGKRTLNKIKGSLNDQPKWLRKFYILRIEAEKEIV